METTIIDKETVLAVFDDDDRAYKVKEIGRELGLGPEERGALRSFLRTLVDTGVLMALPGRRFGLCKTGTLVEGHVRLHPKGYGWLIPEDESIKDAFIPPDECVRLMRGDLVACSIEESPKGPIAHVERVLSRGSNILVGTLRRKGKAIFVEAAEDVLRSAVVINAFEKTDPFYELKDGAVVEIVLERFPTEVTSALGRVVRFIGDAGDIRVEVERILTEGGIIRPFSPEATEQADAYPKTPGRNDVAAREDLRETALCTIDGADAKDFDDAVYGEDTGKGWKVIVAIADVSHYVQEGSPLDEDAKTRSTSVYLPGQCIPMLPESLSNGLCSLKPKVNRLCMCVEMHLSRKGKLQRSRFFEAVLRSKARLTYEQVQEYFDGVDEKEGMDSASAKKNARKIPEPVRESLRVLREVANALRGQRVDRGSQDFDIPEPYFAFDDEGMPEKVLLRERKESNRLIEELMIAANETVAKRFEERGWPCVYRIHEPPNPDKLERFFDLLRFMIKDASTMRQAANDPRALQRLMQEVKDNDELSDGMKTALNSLLLRAMMQARYSAFNIGHFGLGSEQYLHFTSPIRRYPDLLVHRLLREHLLHPRRKAEAEHADDVNESLESRCQWSSTQERRAVDAERAVTSLYGVWFVKDKVGEDHKGTVSSVTEFGCFIRLDDLGVEGLLHISNMPARMRFDEVHLNLSSGRGGVGFALGDRLQINITRADVSKRQIDFSYVHHLDEEDEPLVFKSPPRGKWDDEGGGSRRGKKSGGHRGRGKKGDYDDRDSGRGGKSGRGSDKSGRGGDKSGRGGDKSGRGGDKGRGDEKTRRGASEKGPVRGSKRDGGRGGAPSRKGGDRAQGYAKGGDRKEHLTHSPRDDDDNSPKERPVDGATADRKSNYERILQGLKHDRASIPKKPSRGPKAAGVKEGNREWKKNKEADGWEPSNIRYPGKEDDDEVKPSKNGGSGQRPFRDDQSRDDKAPRNDKGGKKKKTPHKPVKSKRNP
ncbi:MAG: ribonuclease R [Deltaproteobacteria bacterium]|nr:ribonuclease R [Deltaproteobacteria bacterium]